MVLEIAPAAFGAARGTLPSAREAQFVPGEAASAGVLPPPLPVEAAEGYDDVEPQALSWTRRTATKGSGREAPAGNKRYRDHRCRDCPGRALLTVAEGRPASQYVPRPSETRLKAVPWATAACPAACGRPRRRPVRQVGSPVTAKISSRGAMSRSPSILSRRTFKNGGAGRRVGYVLGTAHRRWPALGVKADVRRRTSARGRQAP